MLSFRPKVLYGERMNVPLRRVALHEKVAAEVRAHLARQRLSGRQAAMRLGWTQPYMSRRLTGEIPFDVTDLEAIAGLLNVPVTAFFDAQTQELAQKRPPNARGGRFTTILTALVAA